MLKSLHRILIRASVPVIALLVVWPMLSWGVEVMATAEASLSLEPAQNMYQQGERQAALSFLRRYLLEHPDSPQLAAAQQLMARILLEEQRQRDALFYLQRILPEQRSPQAQLLEAVTLQQLGQLDEADPLLETLDADELFGSDLALYYGCRACSINAQGEPLQALIILGQAFQYTQPHYHDLLYAQVQEILHNQPPELIAEAAFMFADTPLRDLVILQQARLALAEGDRQLARQLARPLVTQSEMVSAQIAAAQLLDQLDGQPWHQRALGVVLPLTGRYAPFGELVKRGIELAVQQQATPEIKVYYLDSAGDPHQAAEAVRRLVQAHRVLAVVGPLIGDAAERGAGQAQDAGVPIITLAHRDGLPQLGSYVFRNSLTAQQQVDALADYAIEELGLNTYAVLHPDNRMGRDFAERFKQAIEERGGDLEHRMSYRDKSTDFRRQLLLLKGEDPDAPEDEPKPAPGDEAEVEVEEEPIPGWPTVDFEALFIPDYADSVALLVPQLAYYGIENVQLLGINGWNSPQLLKQAGRYARGSVFSDGFFAASEDPQVVEFVTAYQQQFGQVPSILEAQGYDSARALLQIVTDPAVVSPAQVQLRLLGMTPFYGVTGLQGFDDQGEAQRALFLLRIARRQLRQIQALPQPVETTMEDMLFQ